MAPDSPGRLGLPRSSRVKKGRDFRQIRETGKRLVLGCMVANWRTLPPGSKPRVGVITSSRVGPAVVRNRARRLLREAFRLHQLELKEPVDLVLVARPSIVGKSFAGVEKDFLTTLRKAGLLRSN